ncbi:MAG: hypothetical protein EOO57_08970 [Hymenobacter sp.]|nr:MAG: hypothetical protein EOO57_08970 [Hymenobacter sp.]
MADKPTTPPPAYFLSLSLENVRSFGAKQTISFARPDGRPAQWTIILGDNGVGKTTVLKSLAAMQPYGASDNLSPYLAHQSVAWWPCRHEGEEGTVIDYEIELGVKLLDVDLKTGNITAVAQRIFAQGRGRRGIMSKSIDWKQIRRDLIYLSCYGYGAGRTPVTPPLAKPLKMPTPAPAFSTTAPTC